MNNFVPMMNLPQKPIIQTIEYKAPTADTTLYVGNLPPSVEDTLFFEIFKKFGNIQTAKIRKDLFSTDSKGYGFVTYQTKEEAERAIKEMRYEEIQGHELKIFFKKNNQDFNQEANLFFRNLPVTMKAKELHQLCEKFGNILSCQIKKDDKGVSLGYAYVQFEQPQEAERAIKALHKTKLGENEIQVEKFLSSKMRGVEQKNLYLKQFPENWGRE